MSQNIFLDPFVSSAPALTPGAQGNGTLTVDKLSHFTVTQDYTAVCTAIDPFTVFTIVGSLDGPVGSAVVGTQFVDEDRKIFLTIEQGPNLFEIGDTFEFSVENGTDLTQENLDTYDELPQKNFGAGVVGENKGDHNIRFQNLALLADREIQDLTFTSKLAGADGNGISIEYIQGSLLTAASKVIQDLTYTAQAPGEDGNDIQIEYIQFTPAEQAEKLIQDILYRADDAGAAGNNISITYVGGGTQGSEVVTVTGTDIEVQIEDGVSTADDIRLAIGTHGTAPTLVDAIDQGNGPNPQTIQAQTFLEGGSDAIGDAGNEVVAVNGDIISVTLESGVSTAQQVKDAIDGSPASLALVSATISGVASTAQTAPLAPTNLENGAENVGDPGNEIVLVEDQQIKVTFVSGESTAVQLKTAIESNAQADALVTVTLSGDGRKEITDLTALAASDITNGESFEASSANNTRTARFYYRKDGADNPPGTGDDVAIDILSSDNANVVAVKTAAAISGQAEWNVPTPPTATFRITNAGVGESNDVQNIDVGDGTATAFNITKIQDGFDIGEEKQTAPVARTFLAGGLGTGTFAFNTKELTEAGSFFEGNAGILVGEMTNQGDEITFGTTTKLGPLALDDDEPGNDPGPRVEHSQRTINDLINNGKAYLYIENEGKAEWSQPAGTLVLQENISLVFTETGNINTILSTSFPLALADGEHIYLSVDRANSANINPIVSTTVPESPKGEDIFRLVSRKGSSLIWWDNSMQREGRKIRIGEVGAQGANQEKLGVGDGVQTIFPISSGLFPISEKSIIVWANAHSFVDDEWNYNQVQNQIEFVDPPATGVEVYIFYLTEGDTISPPTAAGTQQGFYHTISGAEAIAKEFQLPALPVEPGKALVDVIGGGPQQFGVDYNISADTFSWSGTSLDGVLTAGDIIRFNYFS